MNTRTEVEPGVREAGSRAAEQVGLIVDLEAGCVRLRWPIAVTEFPFGAAWIEMTWGEWVEAQGLMAVGLDDDGSHVVGAVSLAELDLTAGVAAGLRPEAWAVRAEDLDLIPPLAVERLLAADDSGNPSIRTRLERLLAAIVRERAAG